MEPPQFLCLKLLKNKIIKKQLQLVKANIFFFEKKKFHNCFKLFINKKSSYWYY